MKINGTWAFNWLICDAVNSVGRETGDIVLAGKSGGGPP